MLRGILARVSLKRLPTLSNSHNTNNISTPQHSPKVGSQRPSIDTSRSFSNLSSSIKFRSEYHSPKLSHFFQTSPRTPPSLGSHILPLPQNHKLGYYICGDPTGTTIFYFHGTPSSRLEASDYHALGLTLNARIIGVDRPGIGLSTYRPSSTLLSFAHDIQTLASHLGLETFKVFGGSGGGPYALACAHELSPSVLKATGVLAGMGPPECSYADARWDRRFAFTVNRFTPSFLLRPVIEAGLGRPARALDQSAFRKVVEEGFIEGPDKDLFDEEAMESFVECTREAFMTGSEGYILDTKNFLRPWGFELADIEAKVLVWNGSRDVFTPLSIAEWMAGRSRNWKVRVFEGETHMSIFVRRKEEVLRDLLAL